MVEDDTNLPADDGDISSEAADIFGISGDEEDPSEDDSSSSFMDDLNSDGHTDEQIEKEMASSQESLQNDLGEPVEAESDDADMEAASVEGVDDIGQPVENVEAEPTSEVDSESESDDGDEGPSESADVDDELEDVIRVVSERIGEYPREKTGPIQSECENINLYVPEVIKEQLDLLVKDATYDSTRHGMGNLEKNRDVYVAIFRVVLSNPELVYHELGIDKEPQDYDIEMDN